ncbi:hypothetical protein BA746_00310 [Vibrio parahaemolyticus]|uniref:P27 family phage terminase small subunit n=1 Tax=Vibrio parahaemolyticus TaxID=670 RepID=UPI0006A57F1C|nr:P27 family phage terminase small subunit [Vibrio parahaemolyticus]KOF30945.1 hypothetical protein ACX04_15915 [Vibrio parahaemolyticus]OTW07811.1 hypothetical protein BA743_16305 [Vibrio parahaemolyticus]OTW23954.1 hypothetical protein BA744_01070 [Vibrio parahaemolyticus]OTW27236.1 hypothetical protein BA746_00310 [Vibrio parahaemolyticus]
MAANNNNNNKIELAIPLTSKEYKKFLSIKEMLEAERTIYPSDYNSIALLVVNISLLTSALISIRDEGAIIYSNNSYGTSAKANPANEVASKANNAIKALMSELLMTPKSKLAVMSEIESVDATDPLTAALLNRKTP